MRKHVQIACKAKIGILYFCSQGALFSEILMSKKGHAKKGVQKRMYKINMHSPPLDLENFLINFPDPTFYEYQVAVDYIPREVGP